MSKGYGHSIHKSPEENYCVGKIQENPVREGGKQTSNGGERTEHREDTKLGMRESSTTIPCVKMSNNGKDANLEGVGVQH